MTQQWKQKLIILLIAASWVMTSALSVITVNAADKKDTTVTVKIQRTEEIPNETGPRHRKGVNGLTFYAYDVSSDYHDLLDKGYTSEQAKQLLALNKELTTTQPVQQAVTKHEGDKDGVAIFTLPMYHNNKESAYLFKEKDEGQETIVGNTVTVFPMTNESGQVMETVNIYPKPLPNPPTPDPNHPDLTFKKDIDRYVVSYGEVINYTLTTPIPEDIGEYKHYEIVDKADESLLLKKGSINIDINQEVVSGVTKNIREDDHGFDIEFEPNALASYAGKEMRIHYQMTLSSQGLPDTDIINEATLFADGYVLKDNKKVRTGGYHFIKLDMLDHTKQLAGAKFVVQNDKQAYLYADSKQNYEWRPTDKLSLTDKELVLLTSNEQGEFEIKGLSYGEYFLTEVVAPKGYVLREIHVPFEIDNYSYELSEKAGIKLEVFNEPEKPTEPVEPTQPPSPTQPPKGILPQTGEKTSILIGMIGLVLIYLVSKKYMTNKERKHEDETN